MRKQLIICLFLSVVITGCGSSSRSGDSHERILAVEKMTNQETLAEWAIGAEYNDVQEASIIKLTNQPALAKVAIASKYNQGREGLIGRLAVEKIFDQFLLSEIVSKTRNNYVRSNALIRLDDAHFMNLGSIVGALDSSILVAHHTLLEVRNACNTIPIEQRGRLCMEVLGIVEAMSDPSVKAEVGDIEMVQAIWEKSSGGDYERNVGGIKFEAGGEKFTLSVKLSQ